MGVYHYDKETGTSICDAGRVVSDNTEDIYGTSDEYNANNTYNVNDICIYGNKLWNCILSCKGITPTEGIHWTQISLKNMPFKFGIDADGNYGYYKSGADTVTPFKQIHNFYSARGENGFLKKGIAYDCGPSNTSATVIAPVSVFFTEGFDTVTLTENSFYGTMTGYKLDGTNESISLSINSDYDISNFICLEWYYDKGATDRYLTFN